MMPPTVMIINIMLLYYTAAPKFDAVFSTIIIDLDTYFEHLDSIDKYFSIKKFNTAAGFEDAATMAKNQTDINSTLSQN